MSAPELPRCVVHIDADCFYAAVERQRLQIPPDQPLAVQQWSGLIAVDYNSRKFGVKRGMSAQEAKKLCPNLRLVHVEILQATTSPSAARADPDPNPNLSQDPKLDLNLDPNAPNSASEASLRKVSLRRYRAASFRMMRIFQRFLRPGDVLCRASIDEAYLDLSASAYHLHLDDHRDFSNFSAVIGRLDGRNAWDLPLMLASKLVHNIRSTIEKELGYTVSAGIANNRIIAKLASSQNKPNKQTIIARSEWARMLAPLKVSSIPGLGGKLGRKVAEYIRSKRKIREEEKENEVEAKAFVARFGKDEGFAKDVTVGDLQKVDEAALVEAFGEASGRWLKQVSRGEDNEPIKPRSRPKSILAMKSFRATAEAAFLDGWLETMAQEVSDRCEEDREMFSRQPKAFVLHYRKKWTEDRGSQAATVRTQISGKISPKLLANLGRKLLKNLEAALPLTRLGMSVTDFVDIPAATVTSYFAANAAESKKRRPESHDDRPRDSGGIRKQTLRWEDVDVTVLDDLPPAIRAEVERELKHGAKSVKKAPRKSGQTSISSFFK